ncbi:MULTISPECIES: hypothetical protein [unclassified Streptomyces]|uniref:hypothetical protein n=1 Tax=unclassified Streptomyces TaxID=2593676 RepID=UPI00224CF624|nr:MULTISPECIES: hypothetical protein [unclassified Streptomyces]MCX4871072.1 hypothetical protein [Streptomyces sp. NBC_00906]MCX4902700.1 hypothetical protein [Streptomyces sp. NBC_00892]
MFPIFIPGAGWVFQPVVPISPGCVYAPVEQPKRFGFRQAALGVLASLVLLWLSLTHPVEVIGAIAAAVALDALVRLVREAPRTLRRRRIAKTGELP